MLNNPLEILWRNKGWILAAGFACCIAAAAVSLLMPDKFRSSCTLIVMPRVFKTELNIEPFDMLVYQQLARSESVFSELASEYESEGLDQKKLENATYVGLISKEGPMRQEKHVPLLKLSVLLSSPTLAMDIANRWSQLFVETTQHLLEAESDATLQYVSEQFDIVSQQLESIDTEINSLKKQTNPDFLETEITERQKQYAEVISSLLETRVELETQRAVMKDREKMLADMQNDDGSWLGELGPLTERTGERGFWGSQTVKSRNLLRQQKHKIDSLVKDTKLYRLSEEYQTKLDTLKNLEAQKTTVDIRIAVLQKQLDSYEKTLEEQAPSISLRMSMSPEDVFATLNQGNPGLLGKLGDLDIESETLNPVYTKLKTQQSTVMADLAGAKEQQEKLNQAIQELGREIDQIKATLLDSNTELELLSATQDVYNEVDRNISENYTKLNEEVRELRKSVSGNAIRLEKLEELETEESNKINELFEALSNYQLEIKRLERLRANAAKTFDTLAEKLNEAKLEKAKTSPVVKVAAPAVVPAEKESPRRSMIAASGLAIGLLLGITLTLLKAMVAGSPGTARNNE